MIRLSGVRHWAGCVLLILATEGSRSPTLAQDFFEIVDVPLVEVDVLVTDAQGRPVTDLSREDFAVRVDGEEQEIPFFSAPPGPDFDGSPESGTFPAYLVILFDNNSAASQTRNAVIEDYREFLRENSSRHQQIMVASVGLAGLEVQQEFTNDLDRTDAALERVAATVARDVRAAEYASLLTDIQKLAGARDPTRRDSASQAATLVSRIIAFSERAREHRESIAGYLLELTQATAGLQGQRSILYIGGGVSASPGESLLTALKGILDRSGDGWARKASAGLPASVATGGSRGIESLSQVASVQGAALYSFVVGGGAQVLSTGSSASSITAKDSSAMDSSGSWSPGFDSSTRNESRSALDSLAASTGGFVHAMTGGARPVLERIHDQMTSRYVLGFHPPGGADGTLHKLKVRVGGAHFRVRYRRSFQARSWDEETAARLRSTLFFGGGEDRHGLEFEVQVPRRESDDGLRIPLTVRLPLSRLTIEPVRDTHRGQASVFVTSLGEGRFETGPVRKSVLPVVLPNDELQVVMGRMAEYRLDVRVPENARELAVAVRDDLSTELSIVRLAVPEDGTVRVESNGVPNTEEIGLPDNAVPVRLPTAALLMSGQQGGSLRLEQTASTKLELLSKAPETSSPDRALALEVHVYVLDSAGQPLSRSSRRARWDPPVEGSFLDLPIELSDASDSLSVLVRNLKTNDFGLAQVSVPGSAMTGPIGEASSLSIGLRIATTEAADSEESTTTRMPGSSKVPTEKGRLSLQKISLGLLEVLETAASGRSSQAQDRLRDLEIVSTSGQSPMAIVDLGKREAKVLATMADGSWERLLPLALLWGELIDDYRRRGLGPLSEHAIAMSTQLASTMARQADTPNAKAEAADLLVSLSGYLLYSQRLGRTEELLELAMRVDEENGQALNALAATREQKGDFEGAIDVLARLLVLSPKNGEARLRMAVNLLRTDQPRQAEGLLRSLAGKTEEAWVTKVAIQELARLLASTSREEEAEQVLVGAIEDWPDEAAMQVQLAWLLDQRHSPIEAGDWVVRVAKGTTGAGESPRFRYHRWYLEGLAGVRQELSITSVERAKEAFEALARDPMATGGS